MGRIVLSRFYNNSWLLLVIASLCFAALRFDGLSITSVRFKSANLNDEITLPAPYIRLINAPQTVTLDLNYRGYGATKLRLMANSCFVNNYSINDSVIFLPQQASEWCSALTIDPKKFLIVGSNTIKLNIIPPKEYNVYSPNVGLSVGVPLLGSSWIRDFLSISAGAFFLAWILTIFRATGFSWITQAILLTAFSFFLRGLLILPNFAFTVDVRRHTSYFVYLAEHFFSPYDYNGPESWNPPAYYMLCVVFIKALEFLQTVDVWLGVRFVSIFCYSIFLYFGVRSLNRLTSGGFFYLGVALLAFWPSGFWCNVWVFNDVLIYPFYAACFYYTLVWFDSEHQVSLKKAILFSALAFSCKASACIPAAVLAACICYKVFLNPKLASTFFSQKLISSYIILTFGIITSIGKPIYLLISGKSSRFEYLGPFYHENLTLINFIPIDLLALITHPFFENWENPHLWNIHFQTMLFTGVSWHNKYLGSVIQTLFLITLIITSVYILTRRTEFINANIPWLFGLGASVCATIVFVLNVDTAAASAFRYYHPVLIMYVGLFMLALKELQQRKLPIIFWVGCSTVVLFIGCSIRFFEVWL